jgi:large subunit ribosomal protein L10
VIHIPTPQKAVVLEETRERLQRTSAYVVMDYRGLTVAEISVLRREMRKAGAELQVLKNTLFRMAAADTDTVVDDSVLHGPTAVAFGYDDPIAPAKVIADFVKTHPHTAIKGGAVGRHTLNADQVKALAKIPPKPVVLSQLAGTLQAPMSKMAAGLNALPTKMAQLLQALAEKQAGAAA